MLALAATVAPAFEVYHSPGDDGTAGAMPATVEIGAGIVMLHLYVRGDAPGVASPVDAACSGADAPGDEICAWDISLEAYDGLEIASFSPAPGVAHAQPSAGVVRANGVHAVTPAPVPRKIGDLGVVASALPGSLHLAAATGIDGELAHVGHRALGIVV